MAPVSIHRRRIALTMCSKSILLGSAITKRLLVQGHYVTSMSPSGCPFLNPSGHRPAWSSSPKVQWAAANAFDSASYRAILEGYHTGGRRPVDAIVSTIGVLLEGNYKGSNASLADTFKAISKGWGFSGGNPLTPKRSNDLYERMNRDAALSVARTWLSCMPREVADRPPPFIFISAEDVFRPIIDPRYILTKRQAEQGLERMSWRNKTLGQVSQPDIDGVGLYQEVEEAASQSVRCFRPVFVRPGVMYHPHTRPLSTLPSTLLDLSSTVHSLLPRWVPSPAVLLKAAQQDSLARLLTLSPLHVDTVAKAVGQAVNQGDIFGIIDTQRIKALAGWKNLGEGSPFPEACF